MSDITIVQYPGLNENTSISPPCWKVHLASRFKKLDYDVKNVRTPGAIKKYNPRGRVPVLLHKGQSIVDSHDILIALDELYPERSLTPKNPKEKALAQILCNWSDETLYFKMVYLRWLVPANLALLKEEYFKKNYPALFSGIVTTFARREVGGRARAQGTGLKSEEVVRKELAECLDAIDNMLEGQDFLTSDAPNRGDLSVYAHIDQLCEPRLTPKAAESIKKYERITAWRKRMAEAMGSVNPI